MLSSSSPVTASTSSGGRAMPARSSTLISVASPSMATWPNSASSRSKRSRRCSTQRHLVPHREQRARHVRSHLATAGNDHVHQPVTGSVGSSGRHFAGAHRLGEHRDRRLRRADGAKAATGVEVGAARVEDAHDDAPDVVALLHDLPDDDVGVVAVGGDDHRVGIARPPPARRIVGVHPVTDDEAAASSRVRAGPSASSFSSTHGHVPALARQLRGDGRTDTPATDHDAFMNGA